MREVNGEEARQLGFRIKSLAQIHGRLTFEPTVSLNTCNVFGDSRIGAFTYIGGSSEVWSSTIGRYCSVAPGVVIGPTEHPLEFVSTHPFQYRGTGQFRGDPIYERLQGDFRNPVVRQPTKVGNDVWIGQNVIIREGSTVGDGAVLAGGAVVLRDVGAYEIWGGNPARFIRRRLPEDLSNALLATTWWKYDISPLKPLYGDPGAFIDAVERLAASGGLRSLDVTAVTFRRESGCLLVDEVAPRSA